MENYYFVNIFETKGLEYLLVIAFLVLFIVFVRYMFVAKTKRKPDHPSDTTVDTSDRDIP